MSTSPFPNRWTRRGFLRGASIASLVGSGATQWPFAAEHGAAGRLQPSPQGVYQALQVRPLINAAGTYTALSGSVMHPEVIAAMDEASRQHVSIAELQEAVSRRVGELLGAEAALVTAGCAAALTAATAACLCGGFLERLA